MKIKTNSWHYQLMQWMEMYPSNRTNLCSYMRGLLMTLLLPPMLIVSPLLFYWSLYTPPATSLLMNLVYFTLMMWGVIGSMMLALLFSLIVGGLISKRIPDFKLPNLKNNIVIQYIKAKKQKFCPVVEFDLK